MKTMIRLNRLAVAVVAVALMSMGLGMAFARDVATPPVQIKAAGVLVNAQVYATAQNTVVFGEFAHLDKGFQAVITEEDVAPDGKSATVLFQGPAGKHGVITLTQTGPKQGTIAAVVDYGDGSHYALAPQPANWVNIAKP